MKKLFLLLALVMACFRPLPGFALTNDFQSWNTLIVQGPFTSSLRTYFEFQTRFRDDASRLERILVRPALWYAITPEWSVWAGYAWTPLFVPRYLNEQRPWQQVVHEKKFSSFGLVNRFRLEERFIENVPTTSWRVRHMVRMSYQLKEASPWYLIGQDEIFFHLNSPNRGPRAGFDQNRFFLGIHRVMSPQVKLEGGYMANLVRNPGPVEDRLNHNLQLTAFIGF